MSEGRSFRSLARLRVRGKAEGEPRRGLRAAFDRAVAVSLRVMALLAVAALVLEHGFVLQPEEEEAVRHLLEVVLATFVVLGLTRLATRDDRRAFLREHRLLPKRHKRMTQGRLSGAEYRLFEEENALPTSELNPVRTRKRDFYKPRPEDRRDGRKPIRPWTRQQRGVPIDDDQLLCEPEPRPASSRPPSELDLENEARGIKLPPPTRKESRSCRARRNDLHIDPWRMPTRTLAFVEKRTVDPFDFAPVSVMGGDASRPLTANLGRVLLRWPRSR